MNKTFIRIVAVILTLIMAFSVVPLTVIAVDKETEKSIATDTSVTVDAENAFAEMLTKSMETKTASEDADCFFAGLDIENDVITVNFTNKIDCTLVVSYYDETSGQLLDSNVFKVPANAKYARFSIDRAKLSEFFVIKAFLLGEKNEPLCDELVSNECTKKIMDIKSKTVDDFDANSVLKLDNDKNNNFVVFDEDVVKVNATESTNILNSYDASTGRYEFVSITSAMKALKAGNTFYLNNGDKENIIAIKIKSIELVGLREAIIYEEETEIDDVFQFVKIDNSITTEGFELDESTLGEGIEYLGESKGMTLNKSGELKEEDELEVEFGVDEDNYLEGTVTATKTFSYTNKGKIVETNTETTGTLMLQLLGDFRAYYYDGYTDISLTITPTVDAYFNFKASYSDSFKIGDFKKNIKGINIGIQPTINVSANGEMEVTANLSAVVGAGYNTDSGFVNKSQAPLLVIDGKVEGTFILGFDVKPTMSFITESVAELHINAPLSLKVYGKIEKPDDSSDVMHECISCVDGTFSLLFSASANASIFGEKITKDDVVFLKEKEVLKTPFYYSMDFENKLILGKCPHKLYKVNFKVLNAGNKASLKGATISLGGGFADNDGNGFYTDTSTITDSFGEAEAYFRVGKTGVTISAEGFLSQEKTIEIKDTYTAATSCLVYLKEHKLYKVEFQVKNDKGEKVSGAIISLDDAYTKDGKELKTVTTDLSGKAVAYYYDGVYSPQFKAENHDDYIGMFSVSGADTTYNVQLEKVPMYKVTFTVKDSDGKVVKNAKIELNGGLADNNGDGKYTDEVVYTNSSGKAVAMYKNGTYTVNCSAEGYANGSESITVKDKDISCVLTLSLLKFKQGDIIEFGSYPQCKVTDPSLISVLNSQPKNWISYGYYTGTGIDNGKMQPSDYMRYADVEYKGEKYRAVVFDQYRPRNTGWTSTVDNTRQYENGYTLNNVYYFKYESLKWRVLDPIDGLVMSESIIDSQPYNNTLFNDNYKYYYQDSTCSVYANDYENSSIRKWLNEDFYNTSFSLREKKRINESELDNSCWLASHAEFDSNTTCDEIFLLSYKELTNIKYGFSSDRVNGDVARIAKGTDYAKCQGLFVSIHSDYFPADNSNWYTRTPSSCAEFACSVNPRGDVIYNSAYVNNTYFGIRPAMRIDLSSIVSEKSASRSIKVSSEKASEHGSAVKESSKTSEPTSINAVSGNDYIVLNVSDYGKNFVLTDKNLLYIDQRTADKDGKVDITFNPKKVDTNSKTLVIGDLGRGVQVYVVGEAIESVTVDDISVRYKSTANLNPKIVVSGDVSYTVTYTSSDEKSIAVDENGVVLSKGNGEAIITVTVTDVYGNTIEDTCVVDGYCTWWQWLIIIFLFGLIWY